MSDGGPIQSSNLARYFFADRAVDDILERYRSDVDVHRQLLAGFASATIMRRPLAYIPNLPFIEPSPGTSLYENDAAKKRYREIDHELNALRDETDDDGAVEPAAIETARAVVRQLSNRSLAPPELSRLSSEAVAMLWAIGNTRYALTVTDGEVGYVVRSFTTTLKKKSNIKVHQFDIRSIR